MKRLRLFALVCATGCAGLFATACGQNLGQECTQNTDCQSDEICYTEGELTNYCAESCTDDAQSCGDDFTCVSDIPNTEDGESYCVQNADLGDTGGMNDAGMDGGTDGGMDGGMSCESNADCSGTKICDTETNTCVEQESQYSFVQVKDTSSGEDACGVDDPGSDLFAVELRDADGNTLGWGTHVNSNITGDPNNFTNTGVIDGEAPSLSNQCVEDFNEDTVVALGCGGNIAVGFRPTGSSSGFVTIQSDHEILVHEYGSQCSTGSTADSYQATVCSYETQSSLGGETEVDSDGDWSNCKTDLGTGKGRSAFSVTLPDSGG